MTDKSITIEYTGKPNRDADNNDIPVVCMGVEFVPGKSVKVTEKVAVHLFHNEFFKVKGLSKDAEPAAPQQF